MHSKLSIVSRVLVASAVVAGVSWLLVADSSADRRVGDRARPRAAATAKAARQAVGAGYGVRCGGYGGSSVCCGASLSALSTVDDLIAKGSLRCFTSNGNQSGNNADLSSELFVAFAGGSATQVTADTARCLQGTKAGEPCAGFADCPSGSCREPRVGSCSSDAKGKVVFFVFSGNPSGDNPDLGDELFVWDVASGELHQMTKFGAWCTSDRTKACTKNSDCGKTDYCRVASISDLQVAGTGSTVWFVSDGDLGDNGEHGEALYTSAAKIKPVKKGLKRALTAGFKIVSKAGYYCSAATTNKGAACTKDEDCGDVCGDGKKGASEECDYSGAGCAYPKYCGYPGSANQCKCVTPQCGNGVEEPGEYCDGDLGCGGAYTCRSDCSGCVLTSSPSAAFTSLDR